VTQAAEPSGEAQTLAAEFYKLWSPAAPAQPGPRDLEQAEGLIKEHGLEGAQALLACLVQVIRKEWPDCRSLSGAAQKYLPDAQKMLEAQKKREEGRARAEQTRQQTREKAASRQEEERRRRAAWDALPAEEREAIARVVRERLGDASVPAAFLQRLCLEEAARRGAGA
jgi:hypothetical protein